MEVVEVLERPIELTVPAYVFDELVTEIWTGWFTFSFVTAVSAAVDETVKPPLPMTVIISVLDPA